MRSAPPSFARSRALFLRLLGFVYLAAFASLTPQILALVGEQGLLPASGYLERAYDLFGADVYRQLPTLLWLWPSDGMLLTLCWSGLALSVAAVAGLAPIPVFALLWLCYLSLTLAGQELPVVSVGTSCCSRRGCWRCSIPRGMASAAREGSIRAVRRGALASLGAGVQAHVPVGGDEAVERRSDLVGTDGAGVSLRDAADTVLGELVRAQPARLDWYGVGRR